MGEMSLSPNCYPSSRYVHGHSGLAIDELHGYAWHSWHKHAEQIDHLLPISTSVVAAEDFVCANILDFLGMEVQQENLSLLALSLSWQ